MAIDYDTSARGRSTTKKALLIGISYRKSEGGNEDLPPIPTSILNVKKFKQLLQDRCKYTDITVMTDEDGVEEELQPTITNLEREIKALGRDVKPGDRRVFYFAGHSDQLPNRTGSEEDGMDEALVALHGPTILDNKLHEWLVKPLPPGSALTAVFDSCTSGTLLDLPHYRCNNVYHPWVNKGKRKSDTLRNNIVRKDCGYARPATRSPSLSSVGSSDQFPGITQVVRTMDGRQPFDSWLAEGTDDHRVARCTSPERIFKCDGWCGQRNQTTETLPQPNVISISSSNDGQTSYDASTSGGGCLSMTSYLIKILREDPELTYSELMTRLNHAVYSLTKNMHNRVRKKKSVRHKARRRGGVLGDVEAEGDEGEMDNFQDLQLGSLTPLDMEGFFAL